MRSNRSWRIHGKGRLVSQIAIGKPSVKLRSFSLRSEVMVDQQAALVGDEMNKVFICEYSWHGSYGAYEQRTLIVNAGSDTEALGICLMEAEETDAKHWTIEEFTTESRPVQVKWASS